MDEKLKNDAKKVMLVQQAGDGQLKAVTNIDKKGKIPYWKPSTKNSCRKQRTLPTPD
jgi:hypothetical protein